MGRTFIIRVMIALAWVLTQQSQANEAVQVVAQPVATTAHAVANLKQQLSVIDRFSANFVQLTLDGSGKTLQRVEGFMQVAKPGKLRWKTEGVYEQLVISDGKSLWVFDADLEQVSIKNMENRLSETPALLLGGDVSAIGEDFIITQAERENAIRFILQPKDTSQLFDSLELAFSQLDAQQSLMQMVIRDASGQVTDIRFENVQNNPEFDQGIFTFEIPEGVDVIDGRHGRY